VKGIVLKFEFAGLEISDDSPPLIIPEIGINHGGSLQVAKNLVKAAVEAGARLIKHQTHIPWDEMSEEAKRVVPGNSDKPIYEIIQESSLGEVEEQLLKSYTESLGAVYLSTPFSRAAVDRLERLDVAAYKVGSGECSNYPLLDYIASKKKPIILSTGMHSLTEIQKSVELLRSHKIPICLMHTTNLYPTPDHLIRLGAITELRNAYPDLQVGLSDHSSTIYAAIASVALGANVLEKHFVITRDMEGPDVSASMDVAELKTLANASEIVWSQRFGSKSHLEEEQVTRDFAFASVVATRDIEPGELLTRENTGVRRPSGGDFDSSQFELILGSRAISPIRESTQIRERDISKAQK
jgi:N-acetylneuraminate synthase